MGIIRNAANRKIRGRIGDTTYYVSMERQIARQALNGSNYGESARRTEAQQSRRVKWSNLVNFYKLSKGWMPKAFESKKKGQSDYNRFMSVNLGTTKVALTKDEAIQGGCVVEPFVITQGSLRSIEVNKLSSSRWGTNIAIGIPVDRDTPVSAFSAAVIAANNWIEEGMQLSFVSYQQFTNSAEVPQCTCAFYEVTLDTTNTKPLYDFLPQFCASVEDGFLCTSEGISQGCFAYILSDQRGGKVRVSSQTLENNNRSMISLYSTPMQTRKAIDSYGLDSEVVLSPFTTTEQQPLPQPLSINSVYLHANQVTYLPGDTISNYYALLSEQFMVINMSLPEGVEIDRVSIKIYDDTQLYNAADTAVRLIDSGINVEAGAFGTLRPSSNDVEYFEAAFSDGRVARIQFAKTSIIDE